MQGHFQIIFSREHCPLLQQRLSWPFRILYVSGVWAYVVASIATPLFILIPPITIWFGVFPIVVNWWAALGLTVYYTATHAVLYYVRSPKHFEALWFANVANSLMWWTYVKAFGRAINGVFGQKIQFKTTLKGASMLMNTAFRDLWMPGLCFALLLATIVTGLVKLFTGATVSSPIAISIVWALYAIIPPFLVLFYATVSRGIALQYLCRVCMVLSFCFSVLAVGLMWGLYPKQYDLGSAIQMSNFFYNAQRVGYLPLDNGVFWRSNSLLTERGPNGTDMTGIPCLFTACLCRLPQL